ncbi:MAG: biopolymer transporter ExbD [Cytophagales bacterium]
MSKVQIKKRGPSLDMTAMCDVAFLLLTFFILTTKFKKDEAVVVDTPSSTIEVKIPESDVITVSIDKTDKVYFTMDKPIREMVLMKVGEDIGVEFTDAEIEEFNNLEMVGLPMANLKGYLDIPAEERKNVALTGVPTDSTKNELGKWLFYARAASSEVGVNPFIAIKGDNTASSKKAEEVIDILQQPPNLLTKFNFITDLEEKPKGL